MPALIKEIPVHSLIKQTQSARLPVIIRLFVLYICRLLWTWWLRILVDSPGPPSLCWQLLAWVQMNAKGMICLFFIEIVSHPCLASSILRRILMHWYQGGIIFFFFTICLAMIYWLRLPPSQRITDPFWEIRFSHLSWVCMWRRSPETVWGETDFEEQQCVNLCGVAPLLLPVVRPTDGPVILCFSLHLSLYSFALFIAR